MEKWIIISDKVIGSRYAFAVFRQRFEKYIFRVNKIKRIVSFKDHEFRFVSEEEWRIKVQIGNTASVMSQRGLEKILNKIEGDDYETFSNELSKLRSGIS